MSIKIIGLFFITALAEIAGCYFPYLWMKKQGGAWLLIPAALSLMLFVWLLTLHPEASGRIYATYGGIYIVTALVWLKVVDGVSLTVTDWVGALVVLVGAGIIISGWE
ncbi:MULTISPECIES: YnfA family protein [Providencia]|uniref:YnfA family protein n=1 Tax=Providencia huaxiensis TaxID=2027290 RepID=A0ABU2IZ75_9GAMM|nr:MULTISPECIES: YnfA family protein [Providencia]MBZ3682041.1 YnfA family protein [Providencia rettgeri]AXH62162.1 YnfA family protein [Providencia huaxiensis]MDT0134355.1 YnfA family protein [Providencia huaxiensis]MDT1980760.1 YnfA family protein [Providencia huaxiensis]QLR00175.1 YnfA family protein [Providencia rettgeri]